MLLAVLLLGAAPAAAGIITFEGIVGPGERRLNPPGGPESKLISDGAENYVFTLVFGGWSFEDSAFAPLASNNPPKNGTDTMSVDGFSFSTFTIQKEGGGVFDLNSIDLANWNLYSPTTVRVTIGVLVQDFFPGTTFGTFLFPASWTGLSSVSFTNVGGDNAWTLDNVVVNTSPVPDPGSTLLLLGMGLVGLWAWRKRCR